MPFVYFIAAGLGVLGATMLAAVVKTTIRRTIVGQLPLRETAVEREPEHSEHSAAMSSPL